MGLPKHASSGCRVDGNHIQLDLTEDDDESCQDRTWITLHEVAEKGKETAAGPAGGVTFSLRLVPNVGSLIMPSPPVFEAAATNSGDADIGAWMIGCVMPSRWHSGVVNFSITTLPVRVCHHTISRLADWPAAMAALG